MPSPTNSTPSKTSTYLVLGLLAGAAGLIYLATKRSDASREFETNPEKHLELVADSEPGDILLFYDGWGVDKLICRVTGSPYYHAAIYAGENQTVEASTPGVLRRELYGRKEAFVVAPAPKGKGRAAFEWAETQIGKGYDPFSLVMIVVDRICRLIHFNYTSNSRYSCGEFVATAFHQAGEKLFPDQELSEVIPGDFARLLPPSKVICKK